jgi:hypothetical protein
VAGCGAEGNVDARAAKAHRAHDGGEPIVYQTTAGHVLLDPDLMSRHPLRFVVRQRIEHRTVANLRLHAWTSVVTWLALLTALSQVALPLPRPIPLLGSNLAAALLVVSVLYWSRVDLLVTSAVAATSVAWAATPFSAWGPGHGWRALSWPLLVVVAMEIARRLSHVYHHEHAAFMKGEGRAASALHAAHAGVWGPFHYLLLTMIHAGWRKPLRDALEEGEREALRALGQVPWVNWAGTAACHAQYVSVPQTVDDLVLAVAEARARGQKVRVVASGFSWTSLVPSEDTLIFCERLDKVTVDAGDPAAPSVWAEAGVTNRQLTRELARFGLSMPWNVVLETVRVAGLVTVGTHGTGKTTATVGDLILALEVVDAEGRLRTLSNETVGEDVMSAARLSLGLFGIIARVKLRVVPIHRVIQDDRRLPARAVKDQLPALIGRHESVEIYWFPFNDDVWMRTVDRTDAPRTQRGHGFWFKAQNLLQNAWLVALSSLIIRFAPALTPALLKVGIRMLPFRARVINLSESHHYHHWIEMMPCGCMEVGFKADPDGANVRRAWEVTERLVDEYARRGLYPLNLSLNVRFIGSSAALLTPAYGDGLTCYIEIMWRGRPEGWVEFTSELCRAWLTEPGALPHWSKEFEHVAGVVPIIREHLGDRRARFLAALAESGLDPDHRFWNPLLRRVLTDELPAG